MKLASIFKAASGTIIAALAFLITTPQIISNFGIERFGFISLLLILFSTASLLDLGVARAIIYYISNNRKEIEKLSVIWLVLILIAGWAFIISGLMYVSFEYFLLSNDNVGDLLKGELRDSKPFICATFFIVIIHAVFRGVLEGLEYFGITSVVKTFIAVSIASLLYISYLSSSDLKYASEVIFYTRFSVLVLLMLYVGLKIKKPVTIDIDSIRMILTFSWKASVSSLSSTLLNYLDRFFGAIYANPVLFGGYSLLSDAILRSLFIPGAISAVLYPSLATSSMIEKQHKFNRAIKYVLVVMLPILFLVTVMGDVVLSYWLGYSLPELDVGYYLFIISLGVLFLSLSQVYYAYLQGVGSVGYTAKLHILQLVIFIPLFYIMAKEYGMFGIVITWCIRAFVDLISMVVYKERYLKYD